MWITETTAENAELTFELPAPHSHCPLLGCLVARRILVKTSHIFSYLIPKNSRGDVPFEGLFVTWTDQGKGELLCLSSPLTERQNLFLGCLYVSLVLCHNVCESICALNAET